MSKVLLVDDDADVQELNRAAFEKKGHEVRLAYSGAEAMKALEEELPDAICLDVMMETGMAGFDVARDAHTKWPKLPIVMLTSINETTPPAFDFGPDGTWNPVHKFLEKPVAPDTLVEETEALVVRQ